MAYGCDDDTEDSGSEDSSSGDSACEPGEVEQLPPQRLAFVVMTCVIGGYTLIGPLQHDLKHHLNIADRGALGEAFTQAVALVQWGKTAMTLGQNIIFACVPTLTRVYISIFFMFLGVLIPPLFVFTLGSNWLGWVVLAYSTIGFSLGVFECTFLSVISPLGPLTKSWAIMGFPAAFGIVNIIGGSLKALYDLPVVYIFWYVVACMPVGAVLLTRIAPRGTKVDGRSYKQAGIRSSLTEWDAWLIRMLPFVLVNIVSHFVMESALPAIFNTYNAHEVCLYGPQDTEHRMNTHWFLVVLYTFMLLSDMGSRRIGYCFALTTSASNFAALFFALFCCAGGLYLLTFGIAALSWFAIAMSFFGSGFNYAVTSKYIDRFVPRKHNLAAYSLWMFLGYLGAIAGATGVSIVKSWICSSVTDSPYQCT